MTETRLQEPDLVSAPKCGKIYLTLKLMDVTGSMFVSAGRGKLNYAKLCCVTLNTTSCTFKAVTKSRKNFIANLISSLAHSKAFFKINPITLLSFFPHYNFFQSKLTVSAHTVHKTKLQKANIKVT